MEWEKRRKKTKRIEVVVVVVIFVGVGCLVEVDMFVVANEWIVRTVWTVCILL